VDKYCDLVELSDLGFQSDRLHSTHSPDMITPFVTRVGNHSTVRTQGTQLTVIAYESASRRLNGCYPIGLLRRIQKR
jgi:hypothetical protein